MSRGEVMRGQELPRTSEELREKNTGAWRSQATDNWASEDEWMNEWSGLEQSFSLNFRASAHLTPSLKERSIERMFFFYLWRHLRCCNSVQSGTRLSFEQFATFCPFAEVGFVVASDVSVLTSNAAVVNLVQKSKNERTETSRIFTRDQKVCQCSLITKGNLIFRKNFDKLLQQSNLTLHVTVCLKIGAIFAWVKFMCQVILSLHRQNLEWINFVGLKGGCVAQR